ncbi:unnamed protein product [Phytophthora fragariaefolia]|uniref:Unnamed protein product n=1 Tax=Phytophthora fragariaefolia TaxID=1490495 RepID=A0A9W6YLZ2_9STRA|nr:unnamed protein product [Phytophthora fragariaefolia]
MVVLTRTCHGAQPPPQILVRLPASFESDVYVFGLVIVDVISGRGMWNIGDNDGIQDDILSDELLKKPANMTSQLWGLIEKMCRYNPVDRLSMADVFRELEALSKQYPMDKATSFRPESHEGNEILAPTRS